MFNIIDLFSGCGGMSLGFEMTKKFHAVLAIDHWEDCFKTYKLNSPETNVLCQDLSLSNPQDVENQYKLPKIDVIIGGPPCQGFSIAGKRIVDDDRNKLYKAFVNYVKFFSPKAFVLENVPNILSIGGGIVKESIIKDFENLGYTLNYKVLTASDYGTPQNRRRAIFVGLKNEKFEFPEKSVEHVVTSFEALSDLPESSVVEGGKYPHKPSSDYQEMIRQGSQVLHNHQITEHNQKTIDIISQVPDGGNYKDLPEELQNTRRVHIAWTRLNSQKPSFTIDTGHRHHFHYKYNRIPTVRESARIQSFPDTFVFLGTRTSQYKQVGNAVPPLLAKAIATKLLKYLEDV